MNTLLDKWLHRVGKLFKIYTFVALLGVGIALMYGFVTGPASERNGSSPTIIFGAIAVIVIVYLGVMARSKAA